MTTRDIPHRYKNGPYSRDEDLSLARWVRHHPGLSQLGQRIWEEAERNGVARRTWRSMRDRWGKICRHDSQVQNSVRIGRMTRTRRVGISTGPYVSDVSFLISGGSRPGVGSSSLPSNCSSLDLQQRKEVERLLQLADHACPYEILRLPQRLCPTLQQIRTSYRSRSLLVHPDKCDHPNAVVAFRRLANAYQRLCAHDREVVQATVRRDDAQAESRSMKHPTSCEPTSASYSNDASSANSAKQHFHEEAEDPSERIIDRSSRCQNCGRTRAGASIHFCVECGSCVECLSMEKLWHCGSCDRCEECCQADVWSALWCDSCHSCGVCCECSGGLCPRR